MELAQLRLVRSWLDDLTFSLTDESAEESDVRVSAPQVLQNPEEPKNYLVRMRVRIHDKRRLVDMTIAGRFALDGDDTDPTVHRMIEYNAPAILFGVARGIVGAVTSMSGRGRVELPSVNLAKLMDG